jgi:hypothetical protein
LKSIVNFEVFGLEESFLRNFFWSCFSQIMSIWHNRWKGVWNLKYGFIKFTQTYL